MGIGNSAGDRERIRNGKYLDEIEKLEAKIKRLEADRTQWTVCAFKAEAEVLRVRSEMPFRSAALRILEHLADKLR